MANALRTWIVYASHWPGLPRDDDRLGTVEARDRGHAHDIAAAQWPDTHVVIQPGGLELTAGMRKIKAKPDWAMIARMRRGK